MECCTFSSKRISSIRLLSIHARTIGKRRANLRRVIRLILPLRSAVCRRKRSFEAARLYGRAKTAMLMHARGIEHHTNGVNNVLSYINLVLATGQIGAPGRGYGTITGQGNGQGGREHGQKADQLPGQRSISNPEHRKHVCRSLGPARSGTTASRSLRR